MTYDYYRIEVLTGSQDRCDLNNFIKERKFKYIEDSLYGGSIFIFECPTDIKLRKKIFNLWGGCDYFAMEGNMKENESFLEKCLKES